MRIHSSIILLSLLTIPLVHAPKTTAYSRHMQLNSTNDIPGLLVASEPCPEDNKTSPNRGCPRYPEASQSTGIFTPEIYHRGSGRISPVEIG